MDFDPDLGYSKFCEILADYDRACESLQALNEADIRAQLIDRVFREALGWPPECVKREEHTDSGYIDYSLIVNGKNTILLEAKSAGVWFTLPENLTRRSLKLDGVLTSQPAIMDAIKQVRGYCDDTATRYGIATNGSVWIFFQAVRTDIPWRRGSCIIFRSLVDIKANFLEFYNLAGFNAVRAGSLTKQISFYDENPRAPVKITSKIRYSHAPLERNKLHAQLHPVTEAFFENIADQDQIEILQKCYVHDQSLRVIAGDISRTIQDSIPRELAVQGAVDVGPGCVDPSSFQKDIWKAARSGKGQLLLVLGGIGCGKTTFIKRYLRTVAPDYSRSQVVFFYVDFLKYSPLSSEAVDQFFYSQLRDILRDSYSDLELEKRNFIKRAYEEDIEFLDETTFRGLTGDAYERALSEQLAKWQSNTVEYVPKILARTQKHGRSVVVFVDNVDQLPVALQADIFQLTQSVTRRIASTTVLSMREESYFTGTLQRKFSAYSNQKFHIASPSFRALINHRIEFAENVLSDEATASVRYFGGSIRLDYLDLRDFLSIVRRSVLQSNGRISNLIESVCFGNMRMALEMFKSFLVSGATDVNKMLTIYHREGSYFVAYHEFLKSVMLCDHQFYREEISPIINLFDVTSAARASHFTAMRILRYLCNLRSFTTPEGPGYTRLQSLLDRFESTFDNVPDVIATAERLLRRQLIECDTRSTETLSNAMHVRVTSAGWFYLRDLSNKFPYLDLVMQDTPIFDAETAEILHQSVRAVDNTNDRDFDKVQRISERFRRVECFLDYLGKEECAEIDGLDPGLDLVQKFVPYIREQYERDREYIQRRLKENKERFEEEWQSEEAPSDTALGRAFGSAGIDLEAADSSGAGTL